MPRGDGRKGLFWALGQLRWSDHAVVATGIAVVIWLGTAASPEVATYDTRSEIVHRGGREMPEGTRTVFQEDFAPGAHFGAFYTSSDGAYGWAVGHNTPAAARANAEAHCMAYGEDCRLVAELWPPGFRDVGGVTLAPAASKGYAAYAGSPGARAFAASQNGAWGRSEGHTTLWSAKSAALEACEAAPVEGKAEYLPPWPCRIIAARWR